MREIEDKMTDETPLNTSLGEKLREILQALSTREGQDELKKLTESLESVKIKEKGSDHEKHYVHIGGGGGEDKGSKVPYSSTLSINSVETWEKQLLSEPKVRHFPKKSQSPKFKANTCLLT